MEKGEKVIIALVVVITILVVVVAAVGMPIMMKEMLKPESCAKTCHEMKPYYDTLQESVHAGMDCHECHVMQKPVTLEMLKLMPHGIDHLVGMMEGKTPEEMAEEIEQKPPASPKSEVCVKCHEERNVSMPKKITSIELSCTKCHDGVRAPSIEHKKHKIGEYHAYESPNYSGYECIACHNDHDMKVKEETCKSCHPVHKSI